MASWEIRMVASSGKSIRSRLAICSGLHAAAQRRSVRRPWRRPIQRTAGPGTAVPSVVAITLASRSCTELRSVSSVARRTTPGGLLRVDKAAITAEAKLDGTYLLRSSDPKLSAEDIALGYKQLLEVGTRLARRR